MASSMKIIYQPELTNILLKLGASPEWYYRPLTHPYRQVQDTV